MEGTWSVWGAWSSCSGTQLTRTRNYTGGVMPCFGNATETESCCLAPNLTITFEEYLGHSNYFRAQGVFNDSVPATSYNDYWSGERFMTPQKFRIGLSCPKMITSIKLRNSGIDSSILSQPR